MYSFENKSEILPEGDFQINCLEKNAFKLKNKSFCDVRVKSKGSLLINMLLCAQIPAVLRQRGEIVFREPFVYTLTR